MIQKREVEYTKEIDDVFVLVIELLKDIKAKKGAGELAAENLNNLINAMGGMDGISEEITHRLQAMQTIGFRSGELIDAIIGQPATPVVQG